MATPLVRTRVLDGFDDAALGQERWQGLLRSGDTDVIYLTWQFQRSWWDTLGRGQLLLIAAERDGQMVALAPFYTESGMVYFLGTSFEADCLDFLGDISDPDVLDALLEAARARVPGFLGFQFYFVPDTSRTGNRLATAADRLGFSCYEEEVMPAVTLDFAGQPEVALAAANKKRLLKYEQSFRREGPLQVQHLRDGMAILPHLEQFFEQHIARWAGTDNPSRFLYPKARLLVERFTRVAAQTGWLRFTRLGWQGRAIAFHYGFCYRGRYVWGTPSFARDLARHSPGQVLLRQLLLAAAEEGASTFDFRTGALPFKLRFANRTINVRTWGLYPSSDRPPRSRRAEGTPVNAIRANP